MGPSAWTGTPTSSWPTGRILTPCTQTLMVCRTTTAGTNQLIFRLAVSIQPLTCVVIARDRTVNLRLSGKKLNFVSEVLQQISYFWGKAQVVIFRHIILIQ